MQIDATGGSRSQCFPVGAHNAADQEQWRNLRHLRAVAAVAEHGTVINAALALHLSQPAVTRSIHALEQALRTTLFHRNSRGMLPTPAGNVVVRRTARAFSHLRRARTDALAAMPRGADDSCSEDRFVRALTYRQLEVFLGLASAGTETQAARLLGLSQPGVNRIIREFEASLGIRLFERTSQGVLPTPAGTALLRGTRLAFEELRLVCCELSAGQSESQRKLVIGALPLTNALFVPQSIERMLHAHADIQITVIDGTYDTLLQKLRHAEIDALVGALRDPLPFTDLVQEHLFDDALSVAVRLQHPLTQAGPLSLDNLIQHDWVAPLPGTPAHAAFERAFQAIDRAPPRRQIQANSMDLIRALLLGSDRLALVSRRLAQLDLQAGTLAVLPVEVRHTERAIGVVRRRHQELSPVLESFLNTLRNRDYH